MSAQSLQKPGVRKEDTTQDPRGESRSASAGTSLAGESQVARVEPLESRWGHYGHLPSEEQVAGSEVLFPPCITKCPVGGSLGSRAQGLPVLFVRLGPWSPG